MLLTIFVASIAWPVARRRSYTPDPLSPSSHSPTTLSMAHLFKEVRPSWPWIPPSVAPPPPVFPAKLFLQFSHSTYPLPAHIGMLGEILRMSSASLILLPSLLFSLHVPPFFALAVTRLAKYHPSWCFALQSLIHNYNQLLPSHLCTAHFF